ncbi:MAG: hypothetical protein RJA47_534 [Actinomycetota bacterium]|jgi:hypothetical protein
MPQFLHDPAAAAVAYSELRRRVTDLLAGSGTDRAQVVVPHCPSWTVKNVLSHMVGVPEDFMAGNMEGVTTEEWTQRQVDRHMHDSIDDLLGVWSALDAQLDLIVPNVPNPIVSQLVFDQVTHEHDIRNALGQPGGRDSSAIAVAEGFMRFVLSRHTEPAVAALSETSVTGFDFVRCLGGRRGADQIAAAGLDVDAVRVFMQNMPLEIPAGAIDE